MDNFLHPLHRLYNFTHMDPASNVTGIWRHWKIIIGALTFFFLVAVLADVVLWYSLQKTNTAAETLNDIIASQPPAPKTDEDKTKLLDSLAAAHKAAAAQVEAQARANGTGKTDAAPPSPAAIQAENDAKIKLLDSLRKSQ